MSFEATFPESTTNLGASVSSAAGTTTNGSTSVTGVTTVTSPGDVGKMITGPGIPAYTFIVSCVTNTSIVLSQPAGAGFGTGPLAYYAVKLGTLHDTGAACPYTRFRAFAASDVASSQGGLAIQQSDDNGVTWYVTTQLSTPAGIASPGPPLESIIVKRYVRAIYINGPTAQGLFNFTSALLT